MPAKNREKNLTIRDFYLQNFQPKRSYGNVVIISEHGRKKFFHYKNFWAKFSQLRLECICKKHSSCFLDETPKK